MKAKTRMRMTTENPSADKALCGWPQQCLFTAVPPSRNNPTPQRIGPWNVFVQGLEHGNKKAHTPDTQTR